MLPNNIQAEKDVLGGILSRKDSISEVVGKLSPEDFYDLNHRAIYKIMMDLYLKEREVDLLSVGDQMDKSKDCDLGMSYLVDITNSGTSLFSAVRIVKDNANLRRLIITATNIVDDAKKGGDVNELYDKSLNAFQKTTDAVRKEVSGPELIHISDKQKDALDVLKRVNKIAGCGTGIKSLDRILGGMDKEELIIISGQTGHGKSMLMQRIALNCAFESWPVLYLSLEMSVSQQVARFYTMSKEDFEDPVSMISKQPIYFYGGKETMNLLKLDSLLRLSTEKYGTKICFIDHIHYFSQSTEDVANEVGLIVRTLKSYARKYQIPIVAISTLRKLNNRSDSVPEIDDLKDSVMIGYDADIIMMIYRDVEDNEEANKLVVKVKKNRPRGTMGATVLTVTDNYNLVEREKTL